MSNAARIVILDGHTVNPGDLSWQALHRLGEVHLYEHTLSENLVERAAKADIVLVNKIRLDKEHLEALTPLKGIVVAATGYNNVDLEAARALNIPVCNAVGYSTPSVAQHVFALLLALTNQVYLHHQSVQDRNWAKARDFSYTLQSVPELAGKILGIYGFGRIGQAVAAIGQAFGMEILATHTHPQRDQRDGVQFVPLEELFAKSWVVSLHAPMSQANEGVVNASLLQKMPQGSYLINTARGGLILEEDLRDVLINGPLAGAALDVLSQEPPPTTHPLYDLPNCLITPHMAWASREARARLIQISVENVAAILRGEPQHVVN